MSEFAGTAIVDPQRFKWRALTGAILGYVFDAIDFMVLALAIPLLIKAWHISMVQAGSIATATLLGAALAGYIWGPITDSWGRKKALAACLCWFGILTFLCGFAENYIQLLILRFLAGLGLGGEWAIGGAMMTEFFPPKQRAIATSAIQSAWPVGYGLALAVAAYLVPVYGWPVLFFFGGSSLLAAVYVLLMVPESPAWLKHREEKRQGIIHHYVGETGVEETGRWTDILKGHYLKISILCTLLCASCLVSYWGAGTWIPTFLANERGLNLKAMAGYLLGINIAGFLGYYAFGFLADRLGRRWNFIIGGVGSGIVVLIWIMMSNPQAIFWMGMVFGFISYGYWGPLAAFISEQFPTRLRGVGVSFCYATGRMFAVLVPMILGGVAQKYNLGIAIGCIAVVFAVGGLIAWFMKETKDAVVIG